MVKVLEAANEKTWMLEVALIGCGAIGSVLAKAIDRKKAGKTSLRWVHDADGEAARRLVRGLRKKPKVAKNIREILADRKVHLVVEAASQRAVGEYAVKVLRSKKDLIILSVGALADDALLKRIKMAAERSGRTVHIPSGAIVGVDGVTAASMESLKKAILITRKPPKALAKAPIAKRLNLPELKKPKVIFEGSARKAVKAFPTSVNVAATLSLAGRGFDRTTVRIIADPKLKRNVHEIHLSGHAGDILTVTKNLQMPEAPGTSRMAALSTIRLLRNLSEAVRVGV